MIYSSPLFNYFSGGAQGCCPTRQPQRVLSSRLRSLLLQPPVCDPVWKTWRQRSPVHTDRVTFQMNASMKAPKKQRADVNRTEMRCRSKLGQSCRRQINRDLTFPRLCLRFRTTASSELVHIGLHDDHEVRRRRGQSAGADARKSMPCSVRNR